MKLRKLGTGHWDRKLIQRMVEKSISDDKEEAVREWRATGDCWWPKYYDTNIPDWVRESQNGPGFCLCGHTIYYHFAIENTLTGEIECVGSDHINAYMIARNISEELNIPVETVSDMQIQAWIKERMKNMKADAWWAEYGDWFNGLIEGLREVDQWRNFIGTGEYSWDSETERNVEKMKPRKKAVGIRNTHGYQMASVFWRWDNPNNSRNQIGSRGYPNETLLADIVFLDAAHRPAYLEWKERYDARRKERIEEVKEIRRLREERFARQREEQREQKRLRQIEQKRLAEMREQSEIRLDISQALEIDEHMNHPNVINMKELYGVTHACSAVCSSRTYLRRYHNLISKVVRGKDITENLEALRVIYSATLRASDEQITRIMELNGEIRGPCTYSDADRLIASLERRENYEE